MKKAEDSCKSEGRPCDSFKAGSWAQLHLDLKLLQHQQLVIHLQGRPMNATQVLELYIDFLPALSIHPDAQSHEQQATLTGVYRASEPRFIKLAMQGNPDMDSFILTHS